MTISTRMLILRLIVAALIGAVYISSVFLPVFLFEESTMSGFHNPVYGIEVLILGGFGLLAGTFGWFANPLFWLGLVLFACRQFWASAGIGLAAILLALTSLLAKTWWFNEGMGTPIAGFGIGFYVWFSSITLLTIASLIFLCVTPRRQKSSSPTSDHPITSGVNPFQA